MFKYLVLIVLLMVATAAHSDSYVEIGLGIHYVELDRPEINLDNPIATFEVGIEKKDITIYFIHNSSLLTHDEEGAGLNMIGVKKRFNF